MDPALYHILTTGFAIFGFPTNDRRAVAERSGGGGGGVGPASRPSTGAVFGSSGSGGGAGSGGGGAGSASSGASSKAMSSAAILGILLRRVSPQKEDPQRGDGADAVQRCEAAVLQRQNPEEIQLSADIANVLDH
jgi:hypothetical protein